MNAVSPRVGLFPPPGLLDWDPATARAFLDGIAAAGIDHVCCADHVSFIAGLGFDGLLQAAALAMLHPSLRISCGLYLLPLRHPVLVARQLADIERLAPGRLTFGVGIGGEDRHEVAICGVDPATRGARMDESLTVLRSLLSGQAVTFHGQFFDLDNALIAPPAPGILLIVGGRSDAAIRRAGRYSDGWLGIWNSPRRFAAAVEMTAEEAARAGRPRAPGRHAMQVWCGLADSAKATRACLAPAMEAFYQLPFDQAWPGWPPCGPCWPRPAFLARSRPGFCRTNQVGHPDGLQLAAGEVRGVERLAVWGQRELPREAPGADLSHQGRATA